MNSVSREEKRAYWQEQLNGWKNSNLPQAIYCQNHDLNKHTFSYWRRKLASEPSPRGQLVPVSIVPNHPIRLTKKESIKSGLSLRLGDRFTIELDAEFNAGTLKHLVNILGQL